MHTCSAYAHTHTHTLVYIYAIGIAFFCFSAFFVGFFSVFLVVLAVFVEFLLALPPSLMQIKCLCRLALCWRRQSGQRVGKGGEGVQNDGDGAGKHVASCIRHILVVLFSRTQNSANIFYFPPLKIAPMLRLTQPRLLLLPQSPPCCCCCSCCGSNVGRNFCCVALPPSP